MKLINFIIDFVDNQIITKGVLNIPTGHNGGYNDLQTQARLLGHSIILTAKCYEVTNDKKYLNTLVEIANYLTSKKFRPKGYAFYHIITKGKDHSNGLMGQAWTIESLVTASTVTGDPAYKNAAVDVFMKHKFDESDGLWYILDISGRIYPKDPTFNHQLWFAACASLLEENEVNKKVNIFLQHIDLNLTIYDSGLIKHPIVHLQSNFKHKMGGIYKHIVNGSIFNRLTQKDHTSKDNLKSLCIGYHAFNTYAFAILKQVYPDNIIWKNPRITKIIDYLSSSEYLNEVAGSPYGYPYNPVGYEVPFSLVSLRDISIGDAEKWVRNQFKTNYNPASRYFDMNSPDSDTLSFRLYEVTRLPNNYLNSIEI